MKFNTNLIQRHQTFLKEKPFLGFGEMMLIIVRLGTMRFFCVSRAPPLLFDGVLPVPILLFDEDSSVSALLFDENLAASTLLFNSKKNQCFNSLYFWTSFKMP